MTMTRNRWQILAFLFSSFLSSWALAGQDKIAPDLQRADPTSIVDVIVQFKDVPTEAEHERVRRHGATLKSGKRSGGLDQLQTAGHRRRYRCN